MMSQGGQTHPHPNPPLEGEAKEDSSFVEMAPKVFAGFDE